MGVHDGDDETNTNVFEFKDYHKNPESLPKPTEAKDYNLLIGILLGSILVGTIAYTLHPFYLDIIDKRIYQSNILGNPVKKEIYIEHKGTKYYSHIDGKEISDIVEANETNVKP